MEAKTCLLAVRGHGGRVGILLVEGEDVVVGIGLDHAKFGGVLLEGRDGGDGDFGALLTWYSIMLAMFMR